MLLGYLEVIFLRVIVYKWNFIGYEGKFGINIFGIRYNFF